MALWSVLAFVRQGLRRRRGRRTARVVDESALGGHGAGDDVVEVVDVAEAHATSPSVAGALARALLALACTIRFDGEDGGTEEAWAASGWRPRADEVSHLMVRESMRYAIYA